MLYLERHTLSHIHAYLVYAAITFGYTQISSNVDKAYFSVSYKIDVLEDRHIAYLANPTRSVKVE